MKTLVVIFLFLGSSFGLSAQEVDEKRQEVLRKLSSQRVSLDFENTFLEEIVDYLRASTGLNIIIHQEVLQRHGEDELRFTIRLKNLRLKSALKLLLGMRDLTATYRDGVLVIVSQDSVHRGVVTRVYDVRDLLFRIRDFPGPSVELASLEPRGGLLPERPSRSMKKGILRLPKILSPKLLRPTRQGTVGMRTRMRPSHW